MKDMRPQWVKASLVIVLLVAALYLAYRSFESNFNVRGGIPGHHGPPPMSPEMVQKMKEANQRKQVADTKTDAKKPDDKKPETAPSGTETRSHETHPKGGE